jgi:hypothetical protein
MRATDGPGGVASRGAGICAHPSTRAMREKSAAFGNSDSYQWLIKMLILLNKSLKFATIDMPV